MLEIRIHGRGGQGVVTAAELLSVAAFDEGRYAQAFPSFGSERTGAPVTSFCRIDDRPIRSREPVTHPDALIVVDPTLLHQVDVFGGATEHAWKLINTSKNPDSLGLSSVEGIWTVGATQIARRHLGRPLPNAALLGGFAALTGAVSLECVERAIRDRFAGAVGDANAAAAREAYAAIAQQLARDLRAPGQREVAGALEASHE